MAKRVVLSEKFYTKKSVVSSVIKELDLNEYDLVVEPSAGSGSFSSLIEAILKEGKELVALDIEPENDKIKKQDFFLYEYPKNKKTLTVGNPPFGRQASLAVKFFNKAADHSNTVAFILPKSFKKESIQKRLNRSFELIKEIDLPDNSFFYGDKDFNIPCVFQIWKKQENFSRIHTSVVSTVVKFVKKNESPDFAVRRVGFYAGKPYWNHEDKNENTHYFLKCNNDKEKYFDKIDQHMWEHDNTVGARSINKNDLMKVITK